MMPDAPKEPATREDLMQVQAVIVGKLDQQAKSLEGMRSQNSNEHGALQWLLRGLHHNFAIFMERFGFLKPKPPPVDIKDRPTGPPGDTQ